MTPYQFGIKMAADLLRAMPSAVNKAQNQPPVSATSTGAPNYYGNRRAAIRLASPMAGAATDAGLAANNMFNAAKSRAANNRIASTPRPTRAPIVADGGVYVPNHRDGTNDPIFRSHADVARLGMPNVEAINAVNGLAPNEGRAGPPSSSPSFMQSLFGNPTHPAHKF